MTVNLWHLQNFNITIYLLNTTFHRQDTLFHRVFNYLIFKSIFKQEQLKMSKQIAIIGIEINKFVSTNQTKFNSDINIQHGKLSFVKTIFH